MSVTHPVVSSCDSSLDSWIKIEFRFLRPDLVITLARALLFGPPGGFAPSRFAMASARLGGLSAAFRSAYARPSNVDWCEANFATHPAVAEFWNTMSSVPMSFVAAYGFLRARQHLRREDRWFWAWAMLGVVGVGSALFHATLRHVFQAADELPMLYCNLCFAYLMIEERRRASRLAASAWNPRLPPSRRRWLAPLLTLIGAAQTVLYFTFPDVYEVFMASYAVVVVWLVWRSVRLAWRAEDATPIQRRCVRAALGCYGGGAVLWAVENAVCGVRGEEKGGWVMQMAHLHAFWHAGACMGTYHFIEFCAARRGAALRVEVELREGGGGGVLPSFVAHGGDVKDANE